MSTVTLKVSQSDNKAFYEWLNNYPQENEIYHSFDTVFHCMAAWVAAKEQARIDVDDLAQFIRTVNGDNKMGAGMLAEKIIEWMEETR